MAVTFDKLLGEALLHTHAGGDVLGQVSDADTVDGQHATEFAAAASAHAAVTLDTNADTLLSLSTQALGLDTQTANTVLSGPTTGAAAVPTFRALVLADVTCLDAELDWRLRYGFMLAR